MSDLLYAATLGITYLNSISLTERKLYILDAWVEDAEKKIGVKNKFAEVLKNYVRWSFIVWNICNIILNLQNRGEHRNTWLKKTHANRSQKVREHLKVLGKLKFIILK